MRVTLHGQLREQYGKHFDIQATSVADAIEGLSRQLPDWPTELVLAVPGFKTAEDLQSLTDIPAIDLVPAMFGGGGTFGKIVLGIALIAIAVINPGIGGMILSQAGVGAVAGAGIGILLGGIMSIFMRAPTISKSEDPPASKYFGLNMNTAESGTNITMAYGLINLFGHWLSLQSDSDKLVTGVFPTTPT